MEVLKRINEIIEPIANERDYCIVDVTYKREGSTLVLRIIADKQGGINMDECAKLNNELSEILDGENIIDDKYIIEVSSPGLDRKLVTDRDFTWAVGKPVNVTTYAPFNDKKAFSGVLVGVGNGTIVLEEGGISEEIPREKIASARLKLDMTLDN